MLCGGNCLFCLFVCSPVEVSCNVSLLCMIIMCIFLFCFCYNLSSFFYAFCRTIFTLIILCFALSTIFLGSTGFVLCFFFLYCILRCVFSLCALCFEKFVFCAVGVLFILCFVFYAVYCFCTVLCNHNCGCLKI